MTGSMASTLGQLNPLRYRGYCYDAETGLYYLQTRYYNPGIGRFINADDLKILEIEQDNLLGDNLFVYCLNNPMKHEDPDGEMAAVVATLAAVGAANVWNPVGWVVVAVLTVVLIADVVYASHRTLKNGSKKKSNDKHTHPRPGRPNEKKKLKPEWNNKNPQKK